MFTKKNLSFQPITTAKRRARGFTLVEVIVSIAIIGIIVVGLSPVFVFSVQSTQYNRSQLILSNLANQKMELIRAIEFNQIGYTDANVVLNEPVGAIQRSENILHDGRQYTINTTIEWLEDYNSAAGAASWDYKLVRVHVEADGFFTSGSVTTKQEVSSLFTRDFMQSSTVGTFIRFRALRYWSVDPVANVYVNNHLGNNIGLTNSRGIALFSVVPAPTTHSIHVDPMFAKNPLASNNPISVILEPGIYPKNGISVPMNTTHEIESYMEMPNSVIITLVNGNDPTHPPLENITLLSPGTLTLQIMTKPEDAIYTHDPTLVWTDSFSETNGHGTMILSNTIWDSLWPYKTGTGRWYYAELNALAGGYLNSSVGFELKNPDNSWSPWSGQFDDYNITQQLRVRVFPTVQLPVNSFDASIWVTGVNFKSNLNEQANFGYATDPMLNVVGEKHLMPVNVTSHPDPQNKLSVGSNDNLVLYATETHFPDDTITISQNASLTLYSSLTNFKSELHLETHNNQPTGKLILKTNHQSIITTTSGSHDVHVDEAFHGVDGGAIGGISETYYGEVYFEKDVFLVDNSGDKTAVLLKSGPYYFPDGFEMPLDIGKTIEEGGLIPR